MKRERERERGNPCFASDALLPFFCLFQEILSYQVLVSRYTGLMLLLLLFVVLPEVQLLLSFLFAPQDLISLLSLSLFFQRKDCRREKFGSRLLLKKRSLAVQRQGWKTCLTWGNGNCATSQTSSSFTSSWGCKKRVHQQQARQLEQFFENQESNDDDVARDHRKGKSERGQDFKMEMKDPSSFFHSLNFNGWFRFTLSLKHKRFLVSFSHPPSGSPSFTLDMCDPFFPLPLQQKVNEGNKGLVRKKWKGRRENSLNESWFFEEKKKVVTDERCPHESSSPSSSSLLQHLICVVFSTDSLSSACKEIMMKTGERQRQEQDLGIKTRRRLGEDWSTRRRKKVKPGEREKQSPFLSILFSVSSLRLPSGLLVVVPGFASCDFNCSNNSNRSLFLSFSHSLPCRSRGKKSLPSSRSSQRFLLFQWHQRVRLPVLPLQPLYEQQNECQLRNLSSSHFYSGQEIKVDSLLLPVLRQEVEGVSHPFPSSTFTTESKHQHQQDVFHRRRRLDTRSSGRLAKG